MVSMLYEVSQIPSCFKQRAETAASSLKLNICTASVLWCQKHAAESVHLWSVRSVVWLGSGRAAVFTARRDVSFDLLVWNKTNPLTPIPEFFLCKWDPVSVLHCVQKEVCIYKGLRIFRVCLKARYSINTIKASAETLHAPSVSQTLRSVEYQSLEMEARCTGSLEITATGSRQGTKHEILDVVRKSDLLLQPVQLHKGSGCAALKELCKGNF